MCRVKYFLEESHGVHGAYIDAEVLFAASEIEGNIVKSVIFPGLDHFDIFQVLQGDIGDLVGSQQYQPST